MATTRKKKALGDDPLFNNPVQSDQGDQVKTVSDQDEKKEKKEKDFSDIVSDEKIEAVKKTINQMKHEVKKLEQRKRNRENEYQRMTFIIRKDLLDKLRDYCYTERISQKIGLEQALIEFLENKEELVSHPERPKQTHKRK